MVHNARQLFIVATQPITTTAALAANTRAKAQSAIACTRRLRLAWLYLRTREVDKDLLQGRLTHTVIFNPQPFLVRLYRIKNARPSQLWVGWNVVMHQVLVDILQDAVWKCLLDERYQRLGVGILHSRVLKRGH